jgi:hypothetical protein
MRHGAAIVRFSVVRRRLVCTKSYSGAWASGGAIFWLDQLAVMRTNKSLVVASGLVGLRRGKSGKVEQIAHDLNVLLDRPHAPCLPAESGRPSAKH